MKLKDGEVVFPELSTQSGPFAIDPEDQASAPED